MALYVGLPLLCQIDSVGIDALTCELSGQGLTAYDTSRTDAARAANVINVVPRGVGGNIVHWVTASDVQLETSPSPCVFGGLLPVVPIPSEGGIGMLTVWFTVAGAATGNVLSLRVLIRGVEVYSGSVLVRACDFVRCAAFAATCVCIATILLHCFVLDDARCCATGYVPDGSHCTAAYNQLDAADDSH